MGPDKLGIVGGGQLGRMLTEAAKPMGFDVMVIDPVENCPAAQVGARQIQADLTDGGAIKALAALSDVVTWEIEHINTEALQEVAVEVQPSPTTLATIKDKLTQKRLLSAGGIPVATFAELDSAENFEADRQAFNGTIVKQRFGGYDGRGNMVLGPDDSWTTVQKRFGDAPLYAEELVPFRKELSVIVGRDKAGKTVPYPVVETIHKDNICHIVLSPPDISPQLQQDAAEVARETMKRLDGAGVFAIEMFLTEDDKVLVNEIAPRVHNSGHHTIEANLTSQFEQHVRAVMGLPLGEVIELSPAVMINILGERNGPVEISGREAVLAHPDTHLHLYGKAPTKVARKMGHITVLADSVEEARGTAIQAREEFGI